MLGTCEADWVDFKRDPHDLKSASGKWHLAKDVAAFANAGGGVLVCGVKANGAAHQPAEIASELWPFPQESVNADALKQTVLRGVQPPPTIRLHWFLHPSEAAHHRPKAAAPLHYLVIEVDPYRDADRLGLVRRWLNDDGSRAEGVGIPVRHGDATRWLTAEEIYRLVNDGHRGNTLAEPREHATRSRVDGDATLTFIEGSQDWDELPVIYLQTLPTNPPELLPGWLDAVRQALAAPPLLRDMGFNFANPYESVRQDDDVLWIGDRRMAMSVTMRGVVTAGVLANGDHLGWAMKERGYPGRLNVVALTEAFLEYFRFATKVVMPAVPGTKWEHRVVARRLQSADPPAMLGEGGNPTFPFQGERGGAVSDEWDMRWMATGDASRDTYLGLERLYALFGLPVQTNPFTADEHVRAEDFLATVANLG